MSGTIHLTYLFDPLCGWCYGASPAVEALIRNPDFVVSLIPSGLFAGTGAFAMNEGFAAHAWEADCRISSLTGQPFSEVYRTDVLGSRTARLDSNSANLAFTAVHLTAPAREFEVLKAIQYARYVDGRDNGDVTIVADILRSLSLSEALDHFTVSDDCLHAANRARIETAKAEMHRFGARGVPTLITGQGQHRHLVSSQALYGGAEILIAALQST